MDKYNLDNVGDFLAEIKTKIYCFWYNKSEMELEDSDLIKIGTLPDFWYVSVFFILNVTLTHEEK